MRMKLVEHTVYSADDFQEININSSNILEDSNGKKYNCIAKYRVPISRYDAVNANGRIYTKQLWENVIRNQKHIWDGCVGLADHPKENEEGSVKNIFCVWKNLHFKEGTNLVYADLYLVGPYGKLAHDVLQAGGKLGFSTSGFGELSEDGKVKPDSYLLERVSDWVINPSQNVFGTLEMEIKEKIKTINSSEDKLEIKEEKDMNIKFKVMEDMEDERNQNNYKGVSMSENKDQPILKLSKIEEKRFLKDIKDFVSEASNISDLEERKKEYLNLLYYLEPYVEIQEINEIKKNIESEIKKIDEEYTNSLKLKEELKEKLGVNEVKDIESKIKDYENKIEILNRKLENYRKIIINLQENMKSKEMNTFSELKEENNKLLQKTERLKKRLAFLLLKEKVEMLKILKLLNSFKEEKETYDSILNEKNKEIVNLRNENFNLKKNKGLLESKLKEYEKKFKFDEKIEVKPSNSGLGGTKFNNRLFVEEEVADYVNDLRKIHGSKLDPYLNRLYNCKTLYEASKVYLDIITNLDKVSILETNDKKLRKKFVEESLSCKIADKKGLEIPKGWE